MCAALSPNGRDPLGRNGFDPLLPNGRGTLFPNRLPTRFRRVECGPEVADLVSWWWISEWDLPPGEVSEQHLLAFPASNLVVEPAGVGFSGPATRGSTRVLAGHGWAVAALLRPACVPAFTDRPAVWRDRYEPIDAPGLGEAIAAHEGDLDAALPLFARWLGSAWGRWATRPGWRTGWPRSATTLRSCGLTSSPDGSASRSARCTASPAPMWA